MEQLFAAGFRSYLAVTGLMDKYISGSHIADPHFTARPYKEFQRWRDTGEVIRNYSMGGWFVVSFAAVNDVFLDKRFSVDIRNSPFISGVLRGALKKEETRFFEEPTLLNTDPPDHTRLRKLARQGFLHKYVAALQPMVERITHECLDAVQNQARFDLVETLAEPLPALVIADILGVPSTDRMKFQAWSEVIAKNARSLVIKDIRKTSLAYNELLEYLAELVENKRTKPRDDLISHLIRAESEGDRLSLEEIHGTCAILLIAGHETTSRLIGNMMQLLLNHPDQLAALRADRSLVDNAIEETLRYESPVQHMTRIALEDIDFHGQRIRKHQVVEVFIGAANRDPLANEQADVFDIHRGEVNHVAFGYGIHLCLGAQLARMEASVALNAILDRFPSISLVDVIPAWEDNDFVRGLERLPIAV